MQWRKNALCNEFGRDSNALVKDAFLEGNIHGHVISEILSFSSPESLLTKWKRTRRDLFFSFARFELSELEGERHLMHEEESK